MTPTLPLQHGGRHRETLKSTAGGPAVLFVIAQGGTGLSLQSTCQICQTVMQERTRSECFTSKGPMECLQATHAETNVCQMFLVSPATVRGWVTL